MRSALLFFVLAACSEPPTTLTVQDPCIEVPRTPISLVVEGGAPAWTSLEVGNNCDAALFISEARIEGDPAFFVTDPPPTPIRRGQRVQLGITFEPEARGTYTALLRIRNNDPEDPVVEVDLDGEW